MSIVIRIIIIGLAAMGVVFALHKLLSQPASIKCGKCKGDGFWMGARGKETCDRCKGTGKISRVRGEY